MSSATTTLKKKAPFTPARLITAGIVLVLLVLMLLSTKILTGDEATNAVPGSFSPASFAQEKFASEIAPDIEQRATDIVTVHEAIAKDPDAAAEQYGIVSGTSPVYSVKFTGTAAQPDANGQMPVEVEGMPSDVAVLVQMGPAINGTSIRDATGKVQFSQFKNQIDYQNVGAELNKQVRDTVLSQVDAATVTGKEVSVTGAFTLVNPKAYIVTPVKIDVAP
jgi:predicted lipoprotein